MPYTAAQLTAYYTAVNFGQAPDTATAAAFNQAAAANAAGTLSDQQALALALQNAQVRATTDVAVAIYQYFNGSAPSQAGINFLLNTPGSGLNTSYYNGATGTATNPSAGGFNLENRYYNLAISQAFQGPNAAAFASTYGGLTLQQTVATAYEQLVGAAVVGSPQATAAITAIQGSITFFQQVAAQRAAQFNQDLATKAIIIGYIMEESIKADVGAYALAVDQHNAAIANGTAVYNSNILTTYAPGPPAYGTGVGGGALPTYLSGGTVAQQRLNLPANGTVIANGTVQGGTQLQLRDASGPSDILNLVFDNGNTANIGGQAGVSVSQLQLGGTASAGQVETLKIVSAGSWTSGNFGSENGMTFSTAASTPNTVTISGSQAFFLFTGNSSHNMLIDGSAATASLTIRGDPATGATVSININGGSANDTLSPGLSTAAVAQTVYGGGGGDLILLSGGTVTNSGGVTGFGSNHKAIDTLVYKAATDSYFGTGAGDPGANRFTVANTGTMDAVMGFISGQDKIDLRQMGVTQAQLTIADKGVLNTPGVDNAGAAFQALIAAGTVFKDSGGITRGASLLHATQDDTGPVNDVYLIIDVNKNGLFDANLDLAIEIRGVATILPSDLIGT